MLNSESIRPQNIIPCTISMIKTINIQSETIKINNKSVETIELVVKTVDQSETALRYEIKIQDYYSTYNISAYKRQNEEKPKSFKNYQYKMNGYVRIIGNIKKNQEQIDISLIYIENIHARAEVDEFYSRLILAFIKLNDPRSNINSIILAAIKTLNPTNNSKGVTITEVFEYLGKKTKLNDIEENCSLMLGDNILCMGADWNHFKINN